MLKDADVEFQKIKIEEKTKIDKLIEDVDKLYKKAERMFGLEDKIYETKKYKNEYVKFIKEGRNNNTVDDQEEFMKTLIKFLFELRTDLLDKNKIDLKIGGQIIEEKKLVEVNISQEEWLNNGLIIDLKNNIVKVAYEIDNIKDENKNSDTNLLKLWKDIKEWASWSKVYETGNVTNENGWYQKQEKDTAVWVRFSTNKKGQRFATPYYAHLKGTTKGIQYNMGWIYEWFQQLLYEEKSLENVTSLFEDTNHPLAIFFKKYVKDTVESLQGGDVGQFQVKYYNQKKIKLLNFSQAFKYLIKIRQNLNDIKDSYSIEYDKAIEKLKDIFTNENENKINESIQKRNNELLEEYFKNNNLTK